MTSATGMVGLVGLLAWMAICFSFGYHGPAAALVALAACASPMVFWAVFVERVHRNVTTAITWERAPSPLADTLRISACKLVGYWSIWTAIAAFYLLMRWYWEGPYLFSMQVLAAAAPLLLVASVPYVFWIDRRLDDPRDGAWHFGLLIMGRENLVNQEALRRFLREWAIKGFFIAYMVAALPTSWSKATGAEATEIAFGPIALAEWLIAICLTIDLVFATAGYMLTFKPLDSHIRSADPYVAGWVAALLCYPPFGGLFDYSVGNSAGDSWAEWLRDYPVLALMMSGWLVLLAAFYAWSTVAFGFRFSNLTNRGIITNGPYMFTKHPAYLSKMVFWWCTVLPFATTTGGFLEGLRNTAALAAITAIYYWRARTEERHLSNDPTYVAYARWMERNGGITRMLSLVPPPRRWTSSIRRGRSAPVIASLVPQELGGHDYATDSGSHLPSAQASSSGSDERQSFAPKPDG